MLPVISSAKVRTPGARRLVAATVLGLVAAPLAGTVPAQANPAGTAVVISEVYADGGSPGAAYAHTYVELYNPTNASVSVAGMGLAYRTASRTSSIDGVAALNGTIPARSYYLVRGGAHGTAGLPVPDPDLVTNSITPPSAGGTVWLFRNSFDPGIGGNLSPDVVDLLGYGGSNTYEGTALPTAGTLTTSLQRVEGRDTDVNSADFAARPPTPGEGYVQPPPPTVVDATIAEIQGTGAASPLVGQDVRTRGVVTSVYPEGGFAGFYLQTAGTGAGDDTTPGASDGVFVYGAAAVAANPVIGEALQVTGRVSEFNGLTELTPDAGGVSRPTGSFDPVTALATAYPATDAGREAHEGELLAPTGPFTVTNTFPTNQYAEIGLATGTTPLRQPTDVARPGTPGYDEVVADNAARAVTLDDGASINFLANAANKAIPLPWLSPANPIRVGARATLHQPVVLDYRNDTWKLQPTRQVTGDGASVATFQDTRTSAPEPVGGDVRLATFNVLNYFDTTGAAFVDAGGACTFFYDRTGTDPVTDDTCTPDGPRGAAEGEDLTRQQAKIVAAVNALGADIVSVEEIENSVKLLGETDRDGAVRSLVDALNTAAGSTRWAFAPSPAAAALPDVAEQDVIRTAFIYNPDTVEPVGPSQVLVGDPDFTNAREPLAQAFKRKGAKDTSAFAVVANHFKSKTDSDPAATGDNANGPQGAFNGDRTRQASSLVDFARAFAAARGTGKVFLTGDFNAYTREDPMQVLYDAGYTAVQSDTAGEATYSFGGRSGSLDHVLANDAALADVTGSDIWQINAGESIAFEYSRHNYNVTDFYRADPFRSSDHDPQVVGFTAPGPVAPLTLNLLGVNDFHGRINANTVKWAGTVERLRADAAPSPTLFVGAGDLIGASEFASAVQRDQPTIDVMNALGLDASAVGNHEFDQGWVDLRDRVIGAAGNRNARWDYLGANVYAKGTTDPVLPEYALFDMSGVSVAVVGAVTGETSSLVSPGGITQIDFGNPVDAVNRVARRLSDGEAANGEAEVIVASFHAGAQQGVGSNYAAEVAKGGEFAQMANLVPAVDVIFNGHTHQAYAWDAPVPGSTATRPILQTGQYAENVGQVTVTVDPDTGDVLSYTARNVARLTTPDADLVAAYPRVAAVKRIVDAALAEAAAIGNRPVGEVTADITRAFSNGSYVDGAWVSPTPRTEDRLSESTLGDLVANALRDGIPADLGDADLGVVNPGGLRADLLYAGDTAANPANTDGVVTYAEANAVLPFVNNIWLVDLTGSELKAVLEQQWQTNPGGPAPSRPFLHLGLSDNVKTTLDPSKPEGSRVTSVTVDGEPLDPAATYTVSTFSFLGTGGDNFRAFLDGSARDTGLVDRDLWIGYLDRNAPVAPDFAREQVYASGLPASVVAGRPVELTLDRLDLTSLGSPENTEVRISVTDGTTTQALGSVPVRGGTAQVAFEVPVEFAGSGRVQLTAVPSGTTLSLPVTARAGATVSGTSQPVPYGRPGAVSVTVTPANPSGPAPTGTVELRQGDRVLGAAQLVGGAAEVSVEPRAFEPGSHALTLRYGGDAVYGPAAGAVTLEVVKATPRLTVSARPTTVVSRKDLTTVSVSVTADGFTPTGTVGVYENDTLLLSGQLMDGAVDLVVGPFTLGRHTLEVRYSGDAHTLPATGSTSVDAVKRRCDIAVWHSPSPVRVRHTRALLQVSVTADGAPVVGKVSVYVGGERYTRTLSEGRASVLLPPFWTVGEKKVLVAFGGNSSVAPEQVYYTIPVVR